MLLVVDFIAINTRYIQNRFSFLNTFHSHCPLVVPPKKSSLFLINNLIIQTLQLDTDKIVISEKNHISIYYF